MPIFAVAPTNFDVNNRQEVDTVANKFPISRAGVKSMHRPADIFLFSTLYLTTDAPHHPETTLPTETILINTSILCV